MRTKADYVLVESFFFFILLPTHNESWLTSLKKSSEVCISHNFSFLQLFFLILQQCHECSLMALVQNSPKCAFAQSQCGLCFLFLCFLSFFLLEHLTQNHCWSSGGAVTTPTQSLRTLQKKRVEVSEEMVRMQSYSYEALAPFGQKTLCLTLMSN